MPPRSAKLATKIGMTKTPIDGNHLKQQFDLIKKILNEKNGC